MGSGIECSLAQGDFDLDETREVILRLLGRGGDRREYLHSPCSVFSVWQTKLSELTLQDNVRNVLLPLRGPFKE